MVARIWAGWQIQRWLIKSSCVKQLWLINEIQQAKISARHLAQIHILKNLSPAIVGRDRETGVFLPGRAIGRFHARLHGHLVLTWANPFVKLQGSVEHIPAKSVDYPARTSGPGVISQPGQRHVAAKSIQLFANILRPGHHLHPQVAPNIRLRHERGQRHVVDTGIIQHAQREQL